MIRPVRGRGKRDGKQVKTCTHGVRDEDVLLKLVMAGPARSWNREPDRALVVVTIEFKAPGATMEPR